MFPRTRQLLNKISPLGLLSHYSKVIVHESVRRELVSSENVLHYRRCGPEMPEFHVPVLLLR
jgi:hypothetical protein